MTGMLLEIRHDTAHGSQDSPEHYGGDMQRPDLVKGQDGFDKSLYHILQSTYHTKYHPGREQDHAGEYKEMGGRNSIPGQWFHPNLF